MLFVEAKWIYNHILGDIKNRATDSYVKTLNHIDVKYQNESISKKLKYISSQMKQGVATQVKSNLSGLKELKKKGKKVGKLKFKSQLDSINLKQYNITYKLDHQRSRLSLQGMKKSIKINGLDQISKLAQRFTDIEIANAKLLKVQDDYYLNITVYHTDEEKTDGCLGIDMGVKEQITLSNGVGLSYNIPESRRLKKLQKKLSKKKGSKKNQKKSSNFHKTLSRVKKEYRKISNKRTNINNHIFNLIESYNHIAMQDEMIKSWHTNKLFGKKIQYSGIGAIKSKIKNLESHRTDILSKSLPTTKGCSNCGSLKDMALKDRVYECKECGSVIPRDLNSTYNMIKMSKFSAEHRKTMPLEGESSALKKLLQVDGLSVRLHPMKKEACNL
jgi:transposase